MSPASTRPLRVLLTNDDGPPSKSESPFVFSFAQALRQRLGWDVRVVIPSSQKSWIGGSYIINDTIEGTYFYPNASGEGEKTLKSRPLKEGEVAEWILLDGTPATCANVALHNLYKDEIDLVISGPNHGRNTSTAFSLASGTIGATLSSTLSGIKSIAVSYAIFDKTYSAKAVDLANEIACNVSKRLYEDWGKDGELVGGEVGLYTVNVPLREEDLSNPKYLFTRVWDNSYQSLFKPSSSLAPGANLPDSTSAAAQTQPPKEEERELSFRFAPEMQGLVNPDLESLPKGSDAWAIHSGFVTISPLRARFDQAGPEGLQLGSGAGAGKDIGVGREWLLDVPARAGL